MIELAPWKDEEKESKGNQYRPITYQDGRVTCSCGRELIQVDEHSYKCSGGYPIYRFDEGDIIKDKFGNLLMRAKEH